MIFAFVQVLKNGNGMNRTFFGDRKKFLIGDVIFSLRNNNEGDSTNYSFTNDLSR